jgi:hypothetical protein
LPLTVLCDRCSVPSAAIPPPDGEVFPEIVESWTTRLVSSATEMPPPLDDAELSWIVEPVTSFSAPSETRIPPPPPSSARFSRNVESSTWCRR